jgi:CRISPR/Cas system-associated protein Cas10 (large subunit of type III CRISPR-Cas system)
MNPILVVSVPREDVKLKEGIVRYFNDWVGLTDYYVLFKFGDELTFELLSVNKARKIDFDQLKKEIYETLNSPSNSI